MNGILLPRNDINFPLVKVIASKIAYKNRWKTKNEHFLTTNYQKVVLEIFSGTLGISCCSKTCFSRPGLSIAPTTDRFGHVHAIKDTIKKKWILEAASLKKTQNCWLNVDQVLIKRWPEHTFIQNIWTTDLRCLKYARFCCQIYP